MGRKEFCNELVNQFNYYSIKNNKEVCIKILKLLVELCFSFAEFDVYTDKIKNQKFFVSLMIEEIIKEW